jgi:hypothetical protein
MADMLATPADLAGRLQQSLDTYTATQALEVATGWIQEALGQKIFEVLNETVTLDGGERTLYLPQRPVIAVGAVSTLDRDGTVFAPVLNTDYRVRGARLIWQGIGRVWPESVTVTYSHGYASNAIPQGLRGLCLDVAARIYHNPAALTSKTVGGVSWTKSAGDTRGAGGLTEAEQMALAVHRPPMVA